jgi:BirA family biotin operon repressor/biotin-[acetyl-CoA-carboxylase] ligase
LRQRWGADDLQARLQAVLPGLALTLHPSLASTNSALVEAARTAGDFASSDDRRRVDGAPPCLCVAEVQTQGRGRLGRAWVSAPGDHAWASLTFSLSLLMKPASWSGLSLAVGVALAEALEHEPPPGAARVRIKWPNDLWLADASAPHGGRKLGGVLIETVATSAGRVAVVGVGLNAQPLQVEAATTGVATWSEIETEASAPLLLHRVAPALTMALQRFEHQGLAPFMPGFAARDALRGRAVVTTLAELPSGWAEGIDAQGALQLRRADGRVVSVHSGEVSVRPTSDTNLATGPE